MKYDLAAYVWPSYTGTDVRTRIFWPEGIGEWETVKKQMKQKPLWGYCDEADPKEMENQIKNAIEFGINTFIYDWYWYDHRPFLENCLNDGFLKAKNNTKMKFYLMWANHDATHLWDRRNSHIPNVIWQAKVDFEEYKEIVNRWINMYFKKENYYKIDNKPILSIFDIGNFINSFKTLEKIKEAISYLDKECKINGFNGIHLQFIKKNNNPYKLENKEYSFEEIVKLIPVDSITHYQVTAYVQKNQDYKNIYPEIKKEYDNMTSLVSNSNLKYYPHVSLGWDDSPRFKIPREKIYNCDKESVKKAMKMAKDYADKNNINLITINSWNEWTESSYLQPDNINGYDYLEAVKEIFID